MIVEIEPKSKEWIAAKGNEVTIKTLSVQACCAPDINEVVAVPGKPKTMQGFREIKVDAISVYLENTVFAKEKLSLKLSGFAPFKSLSVKVQ